MIVCIAEKPSVAKDIAQVLGATHRKDGYYEGNNYQVTWTFGHFCTLKEPHDYFPEWKSWRLDYLPVIPQHFGIKLIANTGVEKQFNIIVKLIADCEYIINCGDAGQEGELIQRWVLLHAKCKVPVKRLWISSLTEEAIKEGFKQLKEASQYDNLYAAGSARAIGDWLLGINATRLFTTKYGQFKAVLSIGRVQTPTLAMVVQRQLEIAAFQSAVYWELKTKYRNVIFTATIPRLIQEERAAKGLNYLLEHPFEITKVEIKEGKEKNPRLFDLTSLQVEANKKLAFSAEHTLKITQSLYEKKHITYPRVDTTYLSEDLYPKMPQVLQNLPPQYQPLVQPLLQAPLPKSKSVFDDTKVTDHHAIIPTAVTPTHLSEDEWQIYELVAKRFIAVFYPDCITSNTVVEGKVGAIPFKVTGKQILVPGWKMVYAKDQNYQQEDDNKEDDNQELPSFENGEQGSHEPFIHKGKTTAPKPYTEATLLRAMETAGKQVDDENLREMLKENGIGRPSTRANIIETLMKRNYIEKKKRNIYATATGVSLIQTIQNDLLKSAELTGVWEQKLRLIEKGTYNIAQFKQELIQMVIELTQEVKNSTDQLVNIATSNSRTEKTFTTGKEKTATDWSSASCPKCGQNTLVKGKTALGCKHYQTCGFKIPFNWYAKKLTDKQMEELVQVGKTNLISGFIVDDQKVKKRLILNKQFELTFDD